MFSGYGYVIVAYQQKKEKLTMNTLLSEALQDFTGLLKQLLTNLLGTDAELWGNGLKKFLRKEPCWSVPPKFKTIKLGIFKSVEEIWHATSTAKLRADFGDTMPVLERTLLHQFETEIELVLITVATLGFMKETRIDEIYACAKELGLELVPAEVGPYLQMQYMDQPKDVIVRIAMEPIVINGHSCVFILRNPHGTPFVTEIDAEYSTTCKLDTILVFTHHKQN
jgi:hypothetical protein